MAAKYECYYCKNIFSASTAIDGYEKGFRVGFLCPNCGENIQAGLQAKQKISSEQYKWAFVAFILFLPTMLTSDSEVEYMVFDVALKLNTLLFFSWLLFVLILWLLKPALFMATTFFTEPVNKA